MLIDIYKSGEVSIDADIDVITPTPELISKFILDNVVTEVDFAICQTIAKTVSPIYDNLSDVANTISKESRQVRDNAGIDQPFRMTYLSSGTTVAGQGLLCIYADFVLSRGMDYGQYKIQIEKFKKLTKGYLVVNDILYARHRTKLRGVKTVALPVAVVGKFGSMCRFFMQLCLGILPAFIRPRLIIQQLHSVGVKTLLIIGVSGLFVGMVLGCSFILI